MDWIQSKLMMLVFAAIPVGTLAFLLMQQTKKISIGIENMPVWGKRGAVGVISIVITAIFTALKLPVPCQEGIDCLIALDTKTLEAMITAGLGSLVAMLVHAKKK